MQASISIVESNLKLFRHSTCAHEQVPALKDGLRQLHILDALDRDGRITEMGRRMAALPLEPSLARSLLAAADTGCLPEALTVVAMLSAESIFAGNRCCFPA